jgi:hypothetical protein
LPVCTMVRPFDFITFIAILFTRSHMYAVSPFCFFLCVLSFCGVTSCCSTLRSLLAGVGLVVEYILKTVIFRRWITSPSAYGHVSASPPCCLSLPPFCSVAMYHCSTPSSGSRMRNRPRCDKLDAWIHPRSNTRAIPGTRTHSSSNQVKRYDRVTCNSWHIVGRVYPRLGTICFHSLALPSPALRQPLLFASDLVTLELHPEYWTNFFR